MRQSIYFFCLGWNMTYLDFFTLRDSLLAHNQVWILLNSKFILANSVEIFLFTQNKLASSANK